MLVIPLKMHRKEMPHPVLTIWEELGLPRQGPNLLNSSRSKNKIKISHLHRHQLGLYRQVPRRMVASAGIISNSRDRATTTTTIIISNIKVVEVDHRRHRRLVRHQKVIIKTTNTVVVVAGGDTNHHHMVDNIMVNKDTRVISMLEGEGSILVAAAEVTMVEVGALEEEEDTMDEEVEGDIMVGTIGGGDRIKLFHFACSLEQMHIFHNE